MIGDERRSPEGTALRDAGRPLTYAVVEAVAAREETSVAELPPLGDAIDPDALDSLFEPRLDGSPRGKGSVTFEYCGRTVVVSSDGQVAIE